MRLQSQVWIDEHIEEGRVQLSVDSDAFIVKGLLHYSCGVQQPHSQDILDFDIEATLLSWIY